MSFGTEDLARLAAAEEIEIETQAPGGPAHRTIVWVVVDGTETFIRSYRGANARWYREAVANPAVAVHVGGRRLAASAISATDPDANERASNGFKVKYATDPATPAMVAPGVLDTTLRLEPT